MSLISDNQVIQKVLETEIVGPLDPVTGGLPVHIISPLEGENLPVAVQDQHTRSLDLKFRRSTAPPTTLSVAAAPNDRTITVANTTGLIPGAHIIITSGGAGYFYQGAQVGVVAGNVVTLDTPIDRDYPIGSTVLPGSDNLNVDGSVTTQIFQIGPVGSTIDVDLTRIMGYIESIVEMDDAKFGGIAGGLAYGIALRTKNGFYTNLWNAKTNGEIALLCFDANYTPKAKQGFYGYRFRNTYAGPSKHGVTIRLLPYETLEILIQDDLTGLSTFHMMAQGHLVTHVTN